MFCADGCGVELENTESYYGGEGTKGIRLDLHSAPLGMAQRKELHGVRNFSG